MHRELIVFSVSNRNLLLKIIKRVGFILSRIKIFVVFSVWAFNFTVMTRSIRSNEIVLNFIMFEINLMSTCILWSKMHIYIFWDILLFFWGMPSDFTYVKYFKALLLSYCNLFVEVLTKIQLSLYWDFFFAYLKLTIILVLYAD